MQEGWIGFRQNDDCFPIDTRHKERSSDSVSSATLGGCGDKKRILSLAPCSVAGLFLSLLVFLCRVSIASLPPFAQISNISNKCMLFMTLIVCKFAKLFDDLSFIATNGCYYVGKKI